MRVITRQRGYSSGVVRLIRSLLIRLYAPRFARVKPSFSRRFSAIIRSVLIRAQLSRWFGSFVQFVRVWA